MHLNDKSKFIRREFYRERMTKIEGSRYDVTNNVKDQVVMSVDCLSIKKIVEVNDFKVRHLEDVVSQQFILGYNGRVMYYVLTRNQSDAPFDFWDIAMVLKDFLNQIGYKKKYSTSDYSRLAAKFKMKVADIRKYAGKLKLPKIVMVGYLLGDTISSYKNWQSFIGATSVKHSNKEELVSIYQNSLTSYQFIPFGVPSPDYQRRAFMEIELRDNIALSSAQNGLEDLASMFGIKLNQLDAYDNYSNLINIIQSNPDKLLASVMVNYLYLGFIANQVREIKYNGLIGKFEVPARLSELGDRISDHFYHEPYEEGQARDFIKGIFIDDNVENYMKPVAFNQLPPDDVIEDWQQVITNIHGKSDEHCKQQDIMLKKLESYLARDTIWYRVASDNKAYRTYNHKKILNKIDFEQLYHNNPNLKPKDLISDEVNLKPKTYKPVVPSRLRRYYRKNKLWIKREYGSNEPENVENILKKLWESSTYGNVYKKVGGKIVVHANNANYYFSQLLDYKYMRNGYHFLIPNAMNGLSRSHRNMNTIKVNQATNRGFEIARLAFKGGLNQAYDHGLINDYKYIYSPDLKSSYPMAGSFIPDFRTDIEPLLDITDVSLKRFNHKVKHKLINGAFTLGVCICSYEFSNDVKRIPVGVRSDMENDSPHYVRAAEHVHMTITDAINIIRHGVKSIHFDRIIIPVQKKLDGNETSLSPVSRAQHWGLHQRELAKKKYGDDSPEQNMFKSFVNFQFGKSAQGLLPKKGNENYKYIGFSRSTNPYIAAQFTSVTRYLVCALAETFEKVYPDSLIPSITTDGMCLCTNEKVDKDKINDALREAYPMWSKVVGEWFNGTFFKFKSKLPVDNKKVSINVPLINLKNRFNFTLDGRVKAMVGVTNGDINKIYGCLKQGKASFMTESMRKSGLDQLKWRANLKHLQAEWNQTVYQNLGYDDFNRVVGFHETDDGLVHYQTEPFYTVEELLATKRDLKPYRRMFPLLKVEYAKAFMNLDDSLVQTHQGLKIKWVNDDVRLKNLSYKDLFKYYQDKYLPKVLLRYLAQNKEKLDLKTIYHDIFNEHYSTYSGFKQAVKRSDGKFVNPLVILKEDWTTKFKKYQK